LKKLPAKAWYNRLMADIYKSPVKSTGKSPPKASAKPRKAKSIALKSVRREVYRLVGKTSNPLSAFIARPRGVAFETQNKKEEIILILRRHWVTNLRWVLTAVLMAVAPVFLLSVPLIAFLPAQFQLIALLMWYLLVVAFIFEQFLGWYFNVYIITDERVIDIDFISLIYKKISDAEIEMIQDVTYKVGGIIQTMFNFGSIYIQTAAEKPEFEFLDVPDPALVVKILQQMRMEEKQEAIEGRVR